MQHLQAIDLNDPSQACMYGKGDDIFKIVKKQAKALNTAMKAYGANVWPLVRKLGTEHRVAPNFVMSNLFARESVWPTGLSKNDRRLLRLLTELFLMHGGRINLRDPQRGGTRGFLLPEDDKAIHKVFKGLVAASAKDFEKPLLRVFSRLEQQVLPEIQEACKCLYGEECSTKDAEELFDSDFIRGLDHDKLPVDRPQAMKALLTGGGS